MMRMISRRRFLMSGAAGLAAGPVLGGAPEVSLKPVSRPGDIVRRFHPQPSDLIAEAKLGGEVGFVALRASDGAVLEQVSGDAGLPPASVAKALTACYAIRILGPDHRFATRLLATGPVIDGELRGDLVLAGGGDPTLDTDALALLARQLKDTGVRKVSGRFEVWGGALPYARAIDPDQPDQVGYNPAVSGLCLNFNRVHFEWRRNGSSYAVTMDARSASHRPDVRVARMQVVARDAPIYTYRSAEGQDLWTVAHGALGKGGARWLPVRKPEIYAGEVFQSFAKSHGIALAAPALRDSAAQGAELARVESARLETIVVDMLKHSTNLTAEAIGMAATTALSGRPKDIAASAREMGQWFRAQTGISDMALVDHSGLGDRSRISAQSMARALWVMRGRVDIKAMMKAFTMRDGGGKPDPDHPVAVQAKTGTLNFVSGLAGYADLSDGSEVVFAIFCADVPRRAGLGREERENPAGASAWNRRAKSLQQALIERWDVMYRA